MIVLDLRKILLTDKDLASMLQLDPRSMWHIAGLRDIPAERYANGVRFPLLGVCKWALSQYEVDEP